MNDTLYLINALICFFENSQCDTDEYRVILNESYSMSHKWIDMPLQEESIR